MEKIIVPGPKTIKLIERHQKVLAATTHDANFSVSIERGEGIYVWDLDGNKYIDCFTQVAIADIGHCHPKVVRAVNRQAKKLMACIGTDVYSLAQVEAAEKLAEIAKKSFPQQDWRVYFCSSGGEANNAAIKLLIDRRPQRKRFISFLGAFHGRFGYALDVASSKSLHKRDYPEALPVIRLPYPDCQHCAYEKKEHNCSQFCIRFIEKEYLGRLCDPEEINGVIIEPIQGEGGFIVPNASAIRKLHEFCKKYDWALIADEVQTGLGRTGKMFAIENFGVKPDIICLAKKLGSGVPIGAIVFPSDWNFTKSGRHSTTFGGGPLGWVSAKATLEVIEEENLVANAAKTGAYFIERLNEIQVRFNNCGGNHAGYISYVRGLGLMIGVEFIDKDGGPNPKLRTAVICECLKNGIIPLAAGHPQRNPIIRFLTPLCVTEADINEIASRFEKALNNAKAAI
ncbi:MAG: aminotransferase class III-fold pyridoxal phosphate-dependent enzyme [Candidatus Nealsonbacteria bacterium]|nr:aminotransferase class III-fold pyridoxal phosphate-dependent enzyme [Candidatus Nealsonbacteria bacterium]